MIQFLQEGANSIFWWPLVDDVSEVDCRFVISSGFEVLITNGRPWAVPEIDYLVELYEQYKVSHFSSKMLVMITSEFSEYEYVDNYFSW